MAPKKDKSKKEDEKTGVFSEVEKTFLELQIAECNRKIARLRATVEEYENRNDELKKSYDKLDEDRADIISYLKKTLVAKNEENNELKEKVKGLDEIRQIENSQFNETVTRLEKNFNVMKDQLTSENKLLAGKLNTLEEFRAIRDDLMKKFEKQEKDFEEQEMKYKRIIYDTEKKYVIAKDKLKKEMEARLLQLAQDFQDATELRIAASTQRVIRENIAVNNEIDNILSTQKKLAEQNEIFKGKLKTASLSKEIAEEERDKALSKNVVQLRVLNELTVAFEHIKQEKALFEKKSCDLKIFQEKLQKSLKENDDLILKVRILEQNLHAKLSEETKTLLQYKAVCQQRDRLIYILQDAAFAIQSALKLDQWAEADPKIKAMDRQLFLSQLLEIVSQYRELQESVSTATVVSFSKVYEEGDLGFVPKSIIKNKASALTIDSVSQQSQKQQDMEVKKTIISSSISDSLNNTSIKTIPSINILPSSNIQEEIKGKVSVESFASSSETVVEEEKDETDSSKDKSDIEKQLWANKLEIQKAMMKDLMFTEMTQVKSQIASLSQANIERLPQFTTSTKSLQQMESERRVISQDKTIPHEDTAQSHSTIDDKEEIKLVDSSVKSDALDEELELSSQILEKQQSKIQTDESQETPE